DKRSAIRDPYSVASRWSKNDRYLSATNAGGYGFLLSQERQRRLCLRQTRSVCAREHLRRSNPSSIWRHRASPVFIPPPSSWGGSATAKRWPGWGRCEDALSRTSPHPTHRIASLTMCHPPHEDGGGIRKREL